MSDTALLMYIVPCLPEWRVHELFSLPVVCVCLCVHMLVHQFCDSQVCVVASLLA